MPIYKFAHVHVHLNCTQAYNDSNLFDYSRTLEPPDIGPVATVKADMIHTVSASAAVSVLAADRRGSEVTEDDEEDELAQSLNDSEVTASSDVIDAVNDVRSLIFKNLKNNLQF